MNKVPQDAIMCLVFIACLGLAASGTEPQVDAPHGLVQAADKARPFHALEAEAEKNQFLALINQYRGQNGLTALTLDAHLQAAAQWLSADMAAKNYFSHTDSLGRDAFQRMAAFGYAVPAAKGENIAAGQATAAGAITSWKNSPGHNANMLNANYRVIGIGLAFGSASAYGWYWTTDFGGAQTMPDPTPTAAASATAAARTGRTVLAFPSPAGDHVFFSWQGNAAGPVRIGVYNLAGERIAVLQANAASSIPLRWDTGNVSPGIYFYGFEADSPAHGEFTPKQKLAIRK